MFRWGVKQELVKADVAAALRDVGGLHKGRTEARESRPVLPFDESTIQATQHHLPAVLADMVRLQRLRGCRPEEICILRPIDVDTAVSSGSTSLSRTRRSIMAASGSSASAPRGRSAATVSAPREEMRTASPRRKVNGSGGRLPTTPAGLRRVAATSPAATSRPSRSVSRGTATTLLATAGPSAAPPIWLAWRSGPRTGCGIRRRPRSASGSGWRRRK
jgi:hypothetical protein